MAYKVYSRADGETDTYQTLMEAQKRADYTACDLYEMGLDTSVTVWDESEPDDILYWGEVKSSKLLKREEYSPIGGSSDPYAWTEE